MNRTYIVRSLKVLSVLFAILARDFRQQLRNGRGFFVQNQANRLDCRFACEWLFAATDRGAPA